MRLRRSRPSGPGWTRRRQGSGFSYLDQDGGTLSGADRERCEALVLPPAWEDVWICPDERGHIQAIGRDGAGRRQYAYHPDWRARNDRRKFDRAIHLLETLPGARRGVTIDLRRDDNSRERALAAAFRILDTASPRIGSTRYLDAHGSRGLSTLKGEHVALDGDRISLRFPGKSGQEWSSEFRDVDLAAYLRRARRRGLGEPLLIYKGDGWGSLSAADINADIRERTGGDFTAKDFRTVHGTLVAAETLAAEGPQPTEVARKRAERAAVKAAADTLGNTIAVARASYIDPRVFDLFRDGTTVDPRGSGSVESQLLALLT